MKIRDKLLLGFGLYILLACCGGFFTYREIGTIGTRMSLVEIADDITNTMLEVRRYEKNYLLYKDEESYREMLSYLEQLKKAIDNIEAEIITQMGSDNYAMIQRDIGEYEYLAWNIAGGNITKSAVKQMRVVAREIQTFTQNLAKKERMNINTMLRTSGTLLLTALALVIVLGMVINIKLATSIATPIRTLERVTGKIAQGDFSERVEVHGRDEVASLGTAFNQMEERLKNALWSLEHAIEKLREKQAQLVEAEKLAAVGKLAAGIAHEINNPLTSVLTFSNLMLEQCGPDDPRRERLKLMTRETERARNIVRQLLNFGREIIIKPERVNVNRPFTDIIDSLNAQEAFKGIELRKAFAPDLPDIYADPAQLGQVGLNLLLNAIHAITPPGVIEVATRFDGRFVELSVSDSGKGIPAEHLNKIFDPFFTTKEMTKGTGLGLAVSYGIVKKHGGDIEVASREGKGTTFIVRLPIHG